MTEPLHDRQAAERAPRKKSGRKTLTEIFTVARDPTLSPGAKSLWLVYRSYDSGKGAHPGDERVIAHLACTDRTLRRLRGELIETGHLRQKLDGPNPARYWAVLPDPELLKDRTQVSTLSPERPDIGVHPRPDTGVRPTPKDRTQDRTQDRTSMSPHSTLSTLSTSVSSSLRSQETAGRGRPARGNSGGSGERTSTPARCPRCGDRLHDPAWAACMACVRAEAGLPREASRPFQEVAP